MAKVFLNGDKVEVDEDMSLLRLIESNRLRPEHIVVEVNRKIIPRNEFSSLNLNEGDEIEIVHMVGGGSL